jgi:hypothetical protein
MIRLPYNLAKNSNDHIGTAFPRGKMIGIPRDFWRLSRFRFWQIAQSMLS